jgi:hypothetical protein
MVKLGKHLYTTIDKLCLKVDKMKQIRSCMRIPLTDLTKEDQRRIKDMDGKILVVDSVEPCLTCGRHRRMKYTQHIDGKLFVLEECLYCLVRVKPTPKKW